MSDFDAQQPIRTTAAESTVSVANASQVTINPAEDYAQGSTTSGENGVLVQGSTTTSSPTYVTGTTNPLSLTIAGALRTDGSATTQPVTGTLTNNNAAPTSNNLGVLPALANAAHPTWTEGDQVLLSEDLLGNLRVSDAKLELAQGSTTSGEFGPLVQGAVTTSSPSYTTGQTNPLSLDTTGNLRIKDSSDGPVTPGTVAATSILAGGQYNSTPPTLTTGQQVALQVDANGRLLVDSNAITTTTTLTYFTDSAVASGGTTTHSIAGPVTLDKIDFTASGEMKGTVAIGITSSEVTFWNGFNSASKQNFSFELSYDYFIPTGSSVKVTLKNRDTAAQDLYVTFFTH